MRKSTPCSFGVIGQSWQRSRIFRSVTPSSTPPGDRGSAFTRPVTSSVDSCVAPRRGFPYGLGHVGLRDDALQVAAPVAQDEKPDLPALPPVVEPPLEGDGLADMRREIGDRKRVFQVSLYFGIRIRQPFRTTVACERRRSFRFLAWLASASSCGTSWERRSRVSFSSSFASASTSCLSYFLRTDGVERHVALGEVRRHLPCGGRHTASRTLTLDEVGLVYAALHSRCRWRVEAVSFSGVDFLGIEDMLSDDERAVRDLVRDFVDDDVLPIIEECAYEGPFPEGARPEDGGDEPLRIHDRRVRSPGPEQRRLRPHGAGARARRLRAALVRLRPVRRSSCIPIYTYGSKEQKDRWIPALAKGESDRLLRPDRARLRLEPGAGCVRSRRRTGTTGS